MIKLTEQELQQLNNFKTSRQNIILEFGNISILRRQIDERESKAAQLWAGFNKSQEEFAVSLEKKYGRGTVDTDTGEFLPID
tara:strand:- start:163 stop:408 length:246 start_codon:yes stop_codon:yes gene_type:complete